jgi:hypothetical protein
MYPLQNQEHAYVSLVSHPVCVSFHVIVGLNFGVLLAWIAISCVTLCIFQWIVRRRDIIAERNRMSPVLPQSDILILQPMQKEEKEPKQVVADA